MVLDWIFIIYIARQEEETHCTEITTENRGKIGGLACADTTVHFPGDANHSLPPTGSFAFTAVYFQSALALSSQAVCKWSSCLEIPPVILLNHS